MPFPLSEVTVNVQNGLEQRFIVEGKSFFDWHIELADPETDAIVLQGPLVNGNNTWHQEIVLYTPDTDTLLFRVVFPEDQDYVTGTFDNFAVVSGTDPASPGEIAIDMLTAIQARGGLTQVEIDFTETNDSDGHLWTNTAIAMNFGHGQTLVEVLAQLVGLGFEWEVAPKFAAIGGDQGIVLSIYNGRSAGPAYGVGEDQELTQPTTAATIRQGQIMQDGESTQTIPPSTTWGEGAPDPEGGTQVDEKTDSAALAGYGRREDFFTNDQALDGPTLSDTAQTRLENLRKSNTAITVELLEGSPYRPGIDFQVGDTIQADLGPRLPEGWYRVARVGATLAGEDDEIRYVVDLGQVIVPEHAVVAVTLSRLLDKTAAGVAIPGSGSSTDTTSGQSGTIVIGGGSAGVPAHTHPYPDIQPGGLSGDLAGQNPAPTVVGVQGRSVTVDVPAAADVLSFDAEGNLWALGRRMNWQGLWVQGTYVEQDVVLDGAWTMLANKTTDDEAAPQPISLATWLYDDDPSWTAAQISDTLTVGTRIHSLDTTYYAEGIRVWIPDLASTTVYQLVVVDNNTGAIDAEAPFEGVDVPAIGWFQIGRPVVMGPGDDFSFIMLQHSNITLAPTTEPWVWAGTSNTVADPGTGKMNTRTNGRSIRINDVDDNSVDQSALLGNVTPGTIVTVTQQSDANKSIAFIVSIAEDQTGYWTYATVVLAEGSSGLPDDDALCDVKFENPQLDPMEKRSLPGHWTGSATIDGIYAEGNATPVFDDNGYGVDVFYQEYEQSPDWDIVAVSGTAGAFGGGGGAGGVPDGTADDDMLTWDNTGELWVAGPTSIDALDDVDTSTVAPTDGQALVWDNAAQKWEPLTVPPPFDGDHDSLTNVTTSQHHARYTDGEAVAAGLPIFVEIAGDTMTGPLILSGAPTLDLHAATKKYVDDNINAFDGDHANLTNVTTSQHHVRYSDAEAIAAVDNGTYLKLAGGTMTGALVLAGAPTIPLHAATKAYVDAEVFSGDHADLTNVLTDQHHTKYTDAEAIAAVDNGTYLKLAGGTMTGLLILSAPPTVDLGAATKKYVDDNINTFDGAHGSLTGVTASQHHTRYADSEAIAATDPLYVSIAGETMTGLLILSAPPVADLGAATKKYVDDNINSFDGDHDSLTNVTTSQHHVRYADGEAVSAMGIKADPNPLNHDRYTDAEAAAKIAADDLYLKLAGDTMTGLLILSGPPVVDLGAATKKYVDDNINSFDGAHGSLTGVTTSQHHVRYADSEAIAAVDNGTYLKLAGGTMTGVLILAAAPTVDLEAATKKYVDDNVNAFDGAHSSLTGVTTSQHHVRYSDAEADARIALADLADLATKPHSALTGVGTSDHHVRYADAEVDARIALADLADLATKPHSALTGVGTSDHHTRYSDAEAIAAVDDGTYLKLAGGTMSGNLSMGGFDITNAQLILGVAASHVQIQPATGFEVQLRDDLGIAMVRVMPNATGDLIFADNAGAATLWWDHSATVWKFEHNVSMPSAGVLDLNTSQLWDVGNITAVETALNLRSVAAAGPGTINLNADDSGGVDRLRVQIQGSGDLRFVKVDGVANALLWDESDGAWELGGAIDMQGNVLLAPLDPTLGTHVGDRDFNDGRYLQLTGGTLTGLLTLSGPPTLDLHAATKKYVDDNAGGGSPTTTAGDMIKRGASIDERLPIGSNGNVLTVAAGAPAWAAPIWLPLAGGIMTGDIDMGGNDLLKVATITDAGNTKRISFDDTANGDLELWRSNGTTQIMRWTDSLGKLELDATDMVLDTGFGSIQNIASYVAFGAVAYGLGIPSQDGGSYGNVSTRNTGLGGWDGYSIRGDFVFMSNIATRWGIYNDTTNFWNVEWNGANAYLRHSNGESFLRGTENGATHLYYNNVAMLSTTSVGISVPVITVTNEIQLTGGTVSDPSLTWDSDTGFYSPSDGRTVWVSNSQNIVYNYGGASQNGVFITLAGFGVGFSPTTLTSNYMYNTPPTTGAAANMVFAQASGAIYYILRSTSSKRYKRKIKKWIPQGEVRNLRPVTFQGSTADALHDGTGEPTRDKDGRAKFKRKWNDHMSFGLIAEEVAEEFPAAVILDEDGDPDGIDWNVITTALIAEVTQLRTEVDALKASS